MTDTKKAAPKSSPKSSRIHSNPHLLQLKAAIQEELSERGDAIRFELLQDYCRHNGYTRTEAINMVNELVQAGVLEFIRRPSEASSYRVPKIRVLLRKVGQEVEQ